MGGGGVNVAIARIQRRSDRGSGLIRRGLKHTQPQRGHHDAAVQRQSQVVSACEQFLVPGRLCGDSRVTTVEPAQEVQQDLSPTLISSSSHARGLIQ